jgi:hypothetical protein
MSEEHRPSEASEKEEGQDPELDKEIVRDLEPEENQAEQVKGASTGACAGDKI